MQVGEVDEAFVLGKVEYLLERSSSHADRGKIEERASRRRDRQPGEVGDLVRCGRQPTVKPDAGTSCAPVEADGHVDDGASRPAHTVRVGRARVAHKRTRTARQHGRPTATIDADHAMTHRIHGAVANVEGGPALTRRSTATGAEPEGTQLVARDDAALAVGDRGDLEVDGEFATHSVV